MKDFYQLIKILEKLGQPVKAIFVNLSDEDSLETKLYRLLQGEVISEDEAIKLLYGDSQKRSAFKMLKSRFKKKLYNQLIFLNHNHSNKLRIQEIECNKALLEADILLLTGDFNLAEKHVLQTINQAKEVGLTGSLIQGVELLRKIISARGGSLTRFNECQNELEHYYKIQDYERRATAIYNDISLKMRLGVTSRLDVLNQLESATTKLYVYWKKSGSSKLFIQYHKLKMLHFELSGNFISQIDFINKTNELYQGGLIKAMYSPLNLNKFALVYAYLRCKKYKEGVIAAEEFKLNEPENSHNWFSNMENYFLLHIHNQTYQQAGEILKEVFSNKFFSKVNLHNYENWLLFSNYYMIISNATLPYSTDLNIKATASKDKKGFNIWLIILDFLVLLKKGKHEMLYKEAERIRKYMSKHLDSNSDPRNKLFLKLLLLVVKEEFDPVQCRQKSRYLYKKLSESPPAGDAYAEVEIVPFEHLWKFVLDNLSAQKTKSLSY